MKWLYFLFSLLLCSPALAAGTYDATGLKFGATDIQTRATAPVAGQALVYDGTGITGSSIGGAPATTTVGALATCTVGIVTTAVYISDCTVCTFGGTCTGGGHVFCPEICAPIGGGSSYAWTVLGGGTGGGSLAGYTGPVSITGSQTNGADQISHVNVNETLVPQTYGASGSAQTITCTATATNNILSCTGVADFKVGQGIFIPHAGPASLNASAPAAPTVTTVGTTGSTHYDYEIVTADSWGGYTAAGASAGVTNGNATPSQTTYSKVTFASPSCAGSYCVSIIYQRIAGAGNYNFYDIVPYPSAGLLNASFPVTAVPGIWPATAPATGAAQNLVASITAISGNNITISPAPTTNSTSVTCLHDDTQGMQAWANALSANAVSGFLPTGTYLLDQPSTWNGSAWVYTNPTVAPAALQMLGMVHLGSHTFIQGAGRTNTIVGSYQSGAVYQSIFAFANPTNGTAPLGGLCNSLGPGAFTTYPVNNVPLGSTILVTTTAANAGNFSPGDRIWYGGGIVDGATSCGSNSTPAAEINEVVWISAITGQIGLKYPSARAYPTGPVGTAVFVAKVNANTASDISISDLRLAAYGGAHSLTLGDVIRPRVQRVDMGLDALPWDNPMNLNEANNGYFSDDVFRSAAWMELDQSRNLRFENDNFRFEGGGSGGLVFTEGGAGIEVINNHFNVSDIYCGIAPFTVAGCDTTTSPALSVGPSDQRVHIIGNEFSGNWKLTGEFISTIAPNSTNDPVDDDVIIIDNVANGTSSGEIFGINTPYGATRLIVSNNRCYLNASVFPSWCIQANSGLISENYLNAPNTTSGTGVLQINTQTSPLSSNEQVSILNNVFTGANNPAIYINGTAGNTGGILIQGNNILSAGGITNSITAVVPKLANNQSPAYSGVFIPVGEDWFGGTGATNASNAATNYMSLQAQTVNATEVNVQMTAPRAGVVGQLRCHLGTTPGAATGWTFTLRDNAASPASGPTCTATAAATCSDLTHSAIVAAGDLLDISIIPNSSPTASTVQCSIQFGT